MKKALLIFLIIIQNVYLSFSQTELRNDSLSEGNSLNIRIESNKNTYHIGDTIRLKILFDNKTNDDLIIAFREGSYHFNQLKISQKNKILLPVGNCVFKIPPLGFLESDYHKLNSKSSIEFELILEIIKFPINRICFEEQFYKSGYGILCEEFGGIFKNIGELKIIMEYKVQFPSSEKESIHSAYHKKNNVWNKNLISNAVNIKIK